MEYVTIFDITQSGYREWPFAVAGLVVLVFGGLLFFSKRFPPRSHRIFSFVFIGFAMVWTLIAFIGPFREYSVLASDLREGRCEITEGVVSEFHPMPYSGHEMEWFAVDGKRFEYSDFAVSPGFNNTTSHGGPIHKGVYVRVYHRGNDIARLEIAR